jgi:hypothetical protein
MPSIINSDDGVVSGTSGLKTTGGNDGLLNIQTNGSTAISISSGQRSTFPTTIGVGNATPSTSGSGITFPATQSASSDANTLDDYEEGTWTPTIQGGSSAGTTTYSSQQGFYIKIGKLVICTADLAASATTGTGQLQIGGLPFTSLTNYQGAVPVMVEAYNWSGGSYMQLYMGSSRTYLVPYTMTDDGGWSSQNMTNEQQNFIFTVSYIANN